MSDHLPCPPLREGILQLEPPRLMGVQCAACHTRTFPPRDFCPACDTDEIPAPVTLAPVGQVFSYTIVHQAPGGRPVPYVLAYVDLDDAVRVLAQVDVAPDAVDIGMRVQLLLRNIMPAPGEPRLGYAFRPQTDTENMA